MDVGLLAIAVAVAVGLAMIIAGLAMFETIPSRPTSRTADALFRWGTIIVIAALVATAVYALVGLA